MHKKVLVYKTRKEKKVTLTQLEVMTVISKTTLNDIENERVLPKMKQLEAIAIALGVKITDLFESE